MASIACRSAQPDRTLFDFRPADNNNNNARSVTAAACNSIAFSRDFSDRKRWRISAASIKSPEETAVVRRGRKMIGSDDNNGGRNNNDRAIVHEKVDEWMRESVTEIVKNLRGAPLLVQVYEGGETTTLAVEEETWPAVMENWGKRDQVDPLPEGVIFVDQLKEDYDGVYSIGEEEDEITRAWGIVVQGKGEGCGPVCYLLKTSRVSSESGRGGLCCTHFCLMKVKSFRESAMSQLKNCWLLQSQ